MAFHVFIIRSVSTGRYSIGQTEHLEQRLAYHNANYSLALRNRGRWELVFVESFAKRGEAVRRERYVKRQKDRSFIESLARASR